MLILARRTGESIWIGEDVEIRIVDLSPSRVKLGIVAPRELTVLRSEVRQAAAQNRAASELAGDRALAGLVTRLRSYADSRDR